MSFCFFATDDSEKPEMAGDTGMLIKYRADHYGYNWIRFAALLFA